MKKIFSLTKYAIAFILSLVMLTVLLMIFWSCAETEHRFIHDEEMISKIEIVEYDRFSLREEKAVVLVEIPDREAFLANLKKIEHKDALRGPVGFGQRTIAFKITYENGDYELFDDRHQAEVYDGLYDGSGMIGYFEREQFYELMSSYLADVENAAFNLLHSDIPIASIDIIKTYTENSKQHETVIATVDDRDDFISKLLEIDYTCFNDDLSQNSAWEYKDKDMAIKITYENGDYEIFSYNCREEYRTTTDNYHPNVYIGTFDYEQFYSLLFEYTES